MQKSSRAERKSPIILGESDHERLSMLADTISTRNEALADTLAAELDRARVVPDKRVPATVIRMGSTVSWKMDTGEEHRATLVFPVDADISNGKVSILTPVGVALIGLSTGQTMQWSSPGGRDHVLTVTHVEPPAETRP